MAKKVLIWSVVFAFLFLVGASYATEFKPHKITEQTIIRGDEVVTDAPYFPTEPGTITDSPGIEIGTTQYDYQTNGSTGNRAFLDSNGGVHFCWMKDHNYNDPARSVYFNYVDANGNWLGETAVNPDQSDRVGYTQISGLSTDQAVVAYHNVTAGFPYRCEIAVDLFAGFGIFEYFNVPNMIDVEAIWPYVTVDRNDNIHIVFSEPDPGEIFGYTRSTDGGQNWSHVERVDTILTLSPVITSSPVSDKVAIVYTHDMEAWFMNDVYYIQSEDGLTWDWRNGKVNVSEYPAWPADSLRAWGDVDAVYDYNDNLHIIWNAWYTNADSGLIYYPVWLYHYDTGSGAITQITESEAPDFETCDTGGWSMAIAKMSIGVHEGTNALFVVYTHFPEDDCSAGGYSNGEIYMNFSVDGGATWSADTNLTNSNTNRCAPGDCDSDHWSTLAERVDEDLHIVYINDKDAGGIPQDEGTVTDNPVLYLAVPNPVTGIDDEGRVPGVFTLSQNYPNPFNAKTSIEFELERDSDVELSVYSITGAKVTTLIDSRLEAGYHSITWDAADVASGVYYYTLKADGAQATRKMTLLK